MSVSDPNVANWRGAIQDAIATPDPTLSNFKITRIHYLLARELEAAIGSAAGANFHSWAVWGSRKAGITIRQEDKDQASRDATIVAGIVGAVLGLGVGWLIASATSWPLFACIVCWVLIGAATGGYCGYLLAAYTRCEAARLILDGNRIVLEDIGAVTAGYLEFVSGQEKQSGNECDAFDKFLATLRPGPSEQDGQDLLRRAFEQYETARTSRDETVRQQANYFANCLAVLHEHIRLQPNISKSLPFLIRKCVTERLMTYSVGQRTLAVHEDVPPLGDAVFPKNLSSIKIPDLEEFLIGRDGWDVGRGRLENTKATDWTKIDERMGYIVNLFRTRHLEPEVVAAPYTDQQLADIAENRLPSRPW